MKLPLEKFVQKEKCPDCGHNIESHRKTNVGIDRTVFECKELDSAGDQCSCCLNESLVSAARKDHAN